VDNSKDTCNLTKYKQMNYMYLSNYGPIAFCFFNARETTLLLLLDYGIVNQILY